MKVLAMNFRIFPTTSFEVVVKTNGDIKQMGISHGDVTMDVTMGYPHGLSPWDKQQNRGIQPAMSKEHGDGRGVMSDIT